MKSKKDVGKKIAQIINIQTVEPPAPPTDGIVGRFLGETDNMFRNRAVRMATLLRAINQSGERTEAMLETALEKMEAAESALQEQLTKEGLVVEMETETGE